MIKLNDELLTEDGKNYEIPVQFPDGTTVTILIPADSLADYYMTDGAKFGLNFVAPGYHYA